MCVHSRPPSPIRSCADIRYRMLGTTGPFPNFCLSQSNLVLPDMYIVSGILFGACNHSRGIFARFAQLKTQFSCFIRALSRFPLFQDFHFPHGQRASPINLLRQSHRQRGHVSANPCNIHASARERGDSGSEGGQRVLRPGAKA